MGERAGGPGAGDRVADKERSVGPGEVSGLKLTTDLCLCAVNFDILERK